MTVFLLCYTCYTFSRLSSLEAFVMTVKLYCRYP